MGGPLTIGGGSLCLGLVLLLGTCIGRSELLPTPLRDAHLTFRPPRKVSTEAPNLSKDEMCFNVSLSISIQVSTTIGSQLSSTPDPEQSRNLARTPLWRVWAEEAVWHHSSMEVMGSRTGEFLDPAVCNAR
jgi:hypothetical protein